MKQVIDVFTLLFLFKDSDRSAEEPIEDRQTLWELRTCKVQQAV